MMNRRNFIRTGISTAASLFLARGMQSSGVYRNPNIKPITASWFEFKHHFELGAKYWNTTFSKFTDEQWRTLIKDISELGIEYLMMLSVADNGKTFYPSKLQPQYDFASPDPLETVLQAADEFGIKFFVSNDYWADYREVHKMMTSTEIAALRAEGMAEIAGKYGHHKSFYGWYYPNETGLTDTLDETTIRYVNECSRLAHELTPHCKTMISPYGIKSVRIDDLYARRLEMLDVDIVSYQDEVGCRKTKAGTAGKYYEQLSKAHAKAGRSRIWADIELFDFEGDVYSSPAVSATFDRLLVQLEDVSPFVERIAVYQYCGMLSKPGSTAATDHPSAERLYKDYRRWLDAQHWL